TLRHTRSCLHFRKKTDYSSFRILSLRPTHSFVGSTAFSCIYYYSCNNIGTGRPPFSSLNRPISSVYPASSNSHFHNQHEDVNHTLGPSGPHCCLGQPYED